MTWDQEIQAELVERFGEAACEVVDAAMEVGRCEEAVVLELLTVYWINVAKGLVIRNPRGWMARHRRNAQYRSWLARARRGVRDGVYARRRGREGPSLPDTESEDSEASSWLRLALSRLPDEIKFAIEARFRLGLTLQETADRLGLGSPAAASRLIERGLAMLRREANRLAASAGA